MSLYVFGDIALRQRFVALVRQELGPTLGQFLELENGQGPAVRFREYVRDATGATDVQRRFFQFLDSVVRDAVYRVEIEIVERQNPPQFGQALAPRQVIDLADLEAIPEDARAITRLGVITHETAERLWLVMHGYVHRAGMNEAERVAWTVLWFEPAHAYALSRESEVTGWRRVEETRRSGVHPRIAHDPRLLHLFQNMIWSLGGEPEELDFTYLRSRAGWSRPSLRRTHIRFVSGIPRVLEVEEQVPVNSRVPGPLGLGR